MTDVTRVMLGTSGYSAHMMGHPDVKRALQQADAIYVNPVILGELLAGFMKGRWKKKNEEELRVFLDSPRVTVVDLDGTTAERYAVILNFLWKSGTPIPTNDIWIAASAMQHGLEIITADAHFGKIPQVVTAYVAI